MAEINGKIIAQGILDRTRDEVLSMHQRPVLGVVVVGNDPVTAKYVAKKGQAAEYTGIAMYIHRFPETILMKKLLEEVARLQLSCDALIIQLPLPKHIETQEILDAVLPEKDADCLSSTAAGRVVSQSAKILSPVAGAVKEILDDIGGSIKGKHVVVVGQGKLVGKPVAAMFLNEPVTLTVCGLETKNLADETKRADILISGTGEAGLITGGMVKKGAIVIDAGTSVDKEGKILGDLDFKSVSKKAKWLTPVPGGVGPLTVAILLENVLKLFNLKNRVR